MKFSRLLEYHKIPEWSAYYIEYRNLKKIINRLNRSFSITSDSELTDSLIDNHDLFMKFKDELKCQLNRLNAFYNEKKAQIEDELDKIFNYIHHLNRINTTIDQDEAQKLLALDERDDAQNRATSMQRAFSDVHKQMWWLELFCEINYIACLRLCEKIPDSEDQKQEIEKQAFRKWDHEIAKLRNSLYEQVASECMDGDIDKAKQLLTRGVNQYRSKDIGRIFFCLGMVITCLLVIAYITINKGNDTLWPSYPVYRLTLAINLTIFAAAYLVYTLEIHSVN